MKPGQPYTKPRVYWLVLALAVVPAIVKWLCYPGNLGSDDAYIHLQIAHNFASGLGWGINPGQPVNLSTSPAFTLLVVAVERAAPQHVVALTQILSASAVVLGLVLIFATLLAETGSIGAALLAEAAAAFSVNLWRWNGSVMEATFAFAVVATTLYLNRRDAPKSAWRFLALGVILGCAVLLRPEMGLVAVLTLFVQWRRADKSIRFRITVLMVLGTAAIFLPWCLFAIKTFGSLVPTTFAAKSTSQLHLFNLVILRQMAATLVESILFPTVLIIFILFASRIGRSEDRRGANPLVYAVPVGWVVGLIGFYYLKTPELQSPGRYVLPLLPAEAMIIGLLWASLEDRVRAWQRQFAVILMAAHAVFAVALNFKLVMPVLQRFEGEYGATMRAAANALAELTEGKPNRRVLVEEDIGVLGYEARGRFEIFDGGALATPSLRGLGVADQMAQVQPAYVLQSLSRTREGLGPEFPKQLSQVWERRFRQHGVGGGSLYEYAIIFGYRKAAKE